MSELIIRTFGGFDVFYSGRSISEIPNRSTKMWTALKYLIAHYKRQVSAEELIEMLWPEGDCSDPMTSLKSLIYRLRKTLSVGLGDIIYITFSQGSYQWNPNVMCHIDAADFEELLDAASDIQKSAEERIDYYNKTISLYRGAFLDGENAKLWLVNFRNYYRRLYLSAVEELVDIYERQSEFEKCVSVYNDAIKVEPYEESLYTRLIRVLINIGDYASAREEYRNIEKLLMKEFDSRPSEELRSLWPEISRTTGNRRSSFDITDLKKSLDQDIVQHSAIFCGIETFKRIYNYDKYLDERITFPVFLGSVSLNLEANEQEEVGDRMQTAMTALRRIMLRTLRQSDIICQNSESSFLLMLTVPDEDQKMAPLSRIRRLFEKSSDSRGFIMNTQIVRIGESEPPT